MIEKENHLPMTKTSGVRSLLMSCMLYAQYPKNYALGLGFVVLYCALVNIPHTFQDYLTCTWAIMIAPEPVKQP